MLDPSRGLCNSLYAYLSGALAAEERGDPPPALA
jgi:hypothetical protein